MTRKYLPITFQNTKATTNSADKYNKTKPLDSHIPLSGCNFPFICVWAGVGGAGGGGGRAGCSDGHLSRSDLIVNIIISGRYVNRSLYLLQHLKHKPNDKT